MAELKWPLPGLYLGKKPKFEEDGDKEDKEVIDLTLDELLPVYAPQPPVKRKISPMNYDAVQVDADFGLIDVGRGSFNEANLVLHSNKQDKSRMLGVQAGDKIEIKYVKNKSKGELVVRYVTRSQYFSPGRPVSSVLVGVDGWESGVRVGASGV